ncbi:hypothetical protein [Kitasatospora mediocidica]|uniref:hypothetical protein n=1 Tax=Kitasatospora mediocidica TaxID=58352 RepID=UPI0018DD4BD0|nr:hypothetical protein [Kitasatospora mediocidica]
MQAGAEAGDRLGADIGRPGHQQAEPGVPERRDAREEFAQALPDLRVDRLPLLADDQQRPCGVRPVLPGRAVLRVRRAQPEPGGDGLQAPARQHLELGWAARGPVLRPAAPGRGDHLVAVGGGGQLDEERLPAEAAVGVQQPGRTAAGRAHRQPDGDPDVPSRPGGEFGGQGDEVHRGGPGGAEQ